MKNNVEKTVKLDFSLSKDEIEELIFRELCLRYPHLKDLVPLGPREEAVKISSLSSEYFIDYVLILREVCDVDKFIGA